MTDVSSPELLEVYTPALGRSVYLRPNTSDEQAWSSAVTGRYHVPELDFVPERILDCGANIGLTAAHYQMLWPNARIVAVEMDADNCAMMALNAPNVQWVHAAVLGVRWSPFVRYQRLGVDAEAYAADEYGSGDTEAPTCTLADVIHIYFDDEQVDFWKCDTESAEWGILAHGNEWKHLVRSALIELHSQGAPVPPSGPWPVGRDGPSPLLAAAVPLLEALGYQATPRLDHPASVWCVRR